MAPVINPSIDISEFRKNPNKAVKLAGRHPLAVLTDNKPSFYVFSPEGFAEIAEIERDTIVARVRSGLDAARRRGVILGAPIKVNDDAVAKARALRAQGLSYKDIAAELNISVGSVHKALKATDTVESTVEAASNDRAEGT